MRMSFALLLAVCVSAYPFPAILNKVNPDPANAPIIYPTCKPSCATNRSCFICFSVGFTSINYMVQYVSLTSPTYVPGAKLTSSFEISESPIILSEVAAIVYANTLQYSMFTTLTTNQLDEIEPRGASTAAIAYDPSRKTAYVPNCTTTPIAGEVLQAIDVTTEKGIWNWNFPETSVTPGGLMGTPVVYKGYLFVMVSNTLYKLDPSNDGAMMWNLTNPCSMIPQAGAGMLQVTFLDVGDLLSALIVYGNTTNAGVQSFSICRISSSSGSPVWSGPLRYDGDVAIQDIVGGAQTILVSGWVTTIPFANHPYRTFALWSVNGSHNYVVFRKNGDSQSYPAVMTGLTAYPCIFGSFVLQVQGVLTVMCVESPTVAWTMPGIRCHNHPVFYMERIICVDFGLFVTMTSVYQAIIWKAYVQAVTEPQVVGNVVIVVDIDSTVFALSIDPAPPSPAAPPSTDSPSLPGGVIFLIVLVIALCIAAVCAGYYYFVKMKPRREAKQMTQVDADGYGSLTAN